MELLLDTHLLIWIVGNSARLSSTARKLVGDPDHDVLFSAASIWEVAIKFSLHRRHFELDPRLLRKTLLDKGYRELPIGGEHTIAVATLPAIHKDPFDRILVAQAMVDSVTLLTADPVLTQYPAPVRLV